MQNILIVKTGGTFPELVASKGDFEHWTAQGMGLSLKECLCVDVQRGETLPSPTDISGCVLTGSHSMVTDNDEWIQTTGQWLVDAIAADLPVLGICFGHQLLADALGGKAEYHPDGLEIGTVNVTLNADGQNDPLLGGLPMTFKAHVTHSQTAMKLPEKATLLATSGHDPHQSFRVGKHAWGVQFHPEFDAQTILRYVEGLTEKITEQGGDAKRIGEDVVETPESASVLKRFAAYCREVS